MGLSDDQKMGTAGIDDVLSCQLSTDSNDTIYAKDMWNPEDQTTQGRRNEINDVSCSDIIVCVYVYKNVMVQSGWFVSIAIRGMT